MPYEKDKRINRSDPKGWVRIEVNSARTPSQIEIVLSDIRLLTQHIRELKGSKITSGQGKEKNKKKKKKRKRKKKKREKKGGIPRRERKGMEWFSENIDKIKSSKIDEIMLGKNVVDS